MITFDFPKYDCCVIDFETATNYTNSACSVGIAVIKNNEIVDTFYSLIQPPNNEYSIEQIAIHGITPNDTVNSPNFSVVWQQIQPYIKNSVYVVAHNAHFDMSVLCESLALYDIKVPIFNYFDSKSYDTTFFSTSNLSLKDRAKQLDIEMNNHHNALEDAKTAAQIIIKTTKIFNYNSIDEFIKKNFINIYQINLITPQSYVNFKRKVKYSRIEVNSINNIVPLEKSKGHILENKFIVFTGEFQQPKATLAKIARECGAVIKSTVSSKTNYLVEGVQQEKHMDENGLVSKQRKAIDLINNGVDIKRITEAQLLDMCK